MNSRSFFAELKRRNVYKVAVAYAVVAWLLIQIATQTFPFFQIPNWTVRLVILLLIFGFPVAIVIAWAFELTPEGIKRTDSASEAPPKRSGRRLWMFVVIGAGLLSAALFFLGRYTASPRSSGSAMAMKSIAVLPFENRSEDKANAYFADGIQDEILTRLAKIDDLKVISRTSTQRYKSSPENLPEIAKQLGVAHVLEGSVQKSGDQVRVNVQLIKAETDGHLWAEVYDRKVADIFAVQSEIAETIAKALQVKLSTRERQVVTAKPTQNSEAYDSYLRGLAIWNSLDVSPRALQQMEEFYARAVQLDPQFALAWSHLSVIRSLTYAEVEPSAERLAKAKHALDSALRLQPGLGEAHFALGLYRYRALRDYDGALKAFDEAIDHGVNKALSIEFSAYVKRRQGKWDEALALHEQSQKLDPRNSVLYSEQAVTYSALRRFPEARRLIDRAIEIMPGDPLLLAQKANTFIREGDFQEAERLLERVPFDPQQRNLVEPRMTLWLYTRRFDEVIRTAEAALTVPQALPKQLAAVYRSWLGFAKLCANDRGGAAADLQRAREEFEALRAESDTGEGFLQDLILVDGFLQNKARVDEHAAKMQDDIERDAFEGPALAEAIAAARTQLGEADAAIEILRRLLSKPAASPLTAAMLRVDPMWDSLRGDARFQELAGGKP